jgi:hypothetical protein
METTIYMKDKQFVVSSIPDLVVRQVIIYESRMYMCLYFTFYLLTILQL